MKLIDKVGSAAFGVVAGMFAAVGVVVFFFIIWSLGRAGAGKGGKL
jgi:uncharacterized membrane protein